MGKSNLQPEGIVDWGVDAGRRHRHRRGTDRPAAQAAHGRRLSDGLYGRRSVAMGRSRTAAPDAADSARALKAKPGFYARKILKSPGLAENVRRKMSLHL